MECRTPLTHPDKSKQEFHCTKCGQENTVQTPEKKTKIAAANIDNTVSTAVKNLNLKPISPVQVATETITVSNSIVVTQTVTPPTTVPLLITTQTPNIQQQPMASQLIPTQLTNLTDKGNFVSGLAMLKPTNQGELVLLTPQNSPPGTTSKFIVCRKEELAVLHSSAVTPGSGLQLMMVPTNKAPEKISVTEKPSTSTSKISPIQELRNYRFNAAKVAVQSQVVEKVQTSFTYTSQNSEYCVV
jgi:hypothetical protein